MTIRTTIHAAKQLASWYDREHRRLPWRATRDPYAIWISETMLQQTRVETVIPYYEAFLNQYPTVADLAAADFEEVAKLWQGLGYYSRARNLHKAAQVVAGDYGGKLPETESDIKSLPGIGPYTAGAVLSIAFNQPIPAVDGNVLRVMARYLGIDQPIETASVKNTITEEVREWLNEAPPRTLTQALMELGATVCTPRSPACLVCPLQADCVAHATQSETKLPVRKPKQSRRSAHVYALWLEWDGLVLMHRRPDSGLLAGMWELPSVEVPWRKDSADAKAGTARSLTEESAGSAAQANRVLAGTAESLPTDIEEQLYQLMKRVAAEPAAPGDGSEDRAGKVREHKTGLQSFVAIAEEKHVFTHIEWQVKVLRPVGSQLQGLDVALEDSKRSATGEEYKLVLREELHQLVLPRVYEKLLEDILDKTT